MYAFNFAVGRNADTQAQIKYCYCRQIYTPARPPVCDILIFLLARKDMEADKQAGQGVLDHKINDMENKGPSRRDRC